MDTATFFARVLPRSGLKVLAELVPYTDKKTGKVLEGWRYTTYQSFDAMAQAAAQFDAHNRTIYHACNGYGDWYFDDVKQKIGEITEPIRKFFEFQVETARKVNQTVRTGELVVGNKIC